MGKQFQSWARYPASDQTATYCNWRAELVESYAQVQHDHGQTLAYGMGRSYGDSCYSTSNHVLAISHMDKFINADWNSGLVVAEAGMTLDELLRVAIPNGWFLPVSPGTKFVTLGGAVANDVHGKNHHIRGSFGNHVQRVGLVRSDEGRLVCSQTEMPELFAATIGGLGLSGIIEWVEVKLVRIESSRMGCRIQRFGNLSEFFDLSSELDAHHEYAVGWVDCGSKGASLGRGVYTVADHLDNGALEYEAPSRITVPITPPLSLINRLSLTSFNQLYWFKQPRRPKTVETGYEPFLYPLDRILEWHRIYGPKGFQQYQCVVPTMNARAATHSLMKEIAASGLGSVLSVLKTFGEPVSLGLLSFPMAGTTLALDFPNNSDSVALNKLFERLDAIVVEADGRLYPAKDAHMSGVDFRKFYPQWEKIEALRDTKLCSKFWQRVCA